MRKVIIPLFGMGLVILSCTKTPETTSTVKIKPGATTLGEKQDNPYSIAAMRKAAVQATVKRSVNPADKQFVAGLIQPTHLYIKFLPQSWDEYDQLMASKTFEVYEYPLDVELQPGEQQYHDPSVPADMPTPHYASVPLHTNLNMIGLKYQLLDSLCIPDETLGAANNTLSATQQQAVIALVNASMRLTGNETDTINTTAGTTARSSYTPGGRVRAWDTRLNNWVGVQGLRMTARRWFTTHVAYTDANGSYRMGDRFKRSCNYKLRFESHGFDVRNGTFGQAGVDGPKQEGDWNVDLNDTEKKFYAHVFRGAYRYMSRDIGGLNRPDVSSGNIKYAAFWDKSKDPTYVPLVNGATAGVSPDILIYAKDNNGYLDSDEVFSAVIHETAHLTHWQNAGAYRFAVSGNFVRESWAVGVEWFITQMEYRERGIADYAEPEYTAGTLTYPLNYGFQYWQIGIGQDDYSSLFIDLVDDYDQLGIAHGTWNASPVNDQIVGYTFQNLEQQVLRYTESPNDLQNRLKTYRPAGVTDAQIDLLFTSF